MLKKFMPNEHVKSIFHIKPEMLKKRGIKAVITDLDNTLVEWDRPNATPELLEWFQELQDHGIVTTIISNNNRERVEAFASPIDMPYIYRAKKPMTQAFKKALADMDIAKEEAVVIGDQLLTDVLGGNRFGLHTILVTPVASTDGFWTKFNRKMERLLLERMKQKGYVKWEEEQN